MLTIDREQLAEFEQQLDPLHPEAGTIPVRVLGYGEISTVFAMGDDALAYKRMPIFQSQEELRAYEAIYDEYNRLLAQDAGIRLPEHTRVSVPGRDGLPVLYIVQQRLDPATIGHKVIHQLDDQQLNQYLDGDSWQGKAGAFGYQDRLGWVHVVRGSESNVVGLPLELLAEMLEQHQPSTW
jgi:hypothetical protein